MSIVRSAVIAAAGLGSRLGLGLPKCMLEIDGRTLLSRQIEVLRGKVDRIHVVVGYREELVISYCAKHYPEVILVRNPEFRTTNTAFSFSLGAKALSGKVLFMDGDLVVPPEALQSFIDQAADCDMLVGCTPAASDNAVYVSCSANPGAASAVTVHSFSFEQKSDYEWGNIFVGPPNIMNGATGYVFQALAPKLPLPGYILELSEVDTPNDLDTTKQFVRDHGL